MEKTIYNQSTIACALMSATIALVATFGVSARADAATFALDFTGTATSTTGNYASETVGLNLVTGSVFIDDDLQITDVSAGADKVILGSPTNSAATGNMSVSLQYGSITETFSTPINTIGSFQITDGNIAFYDVLFIGLSNDFLGRFDIQLQGSTTGDLVGVDPTLGFSLALLQSIDVSAASSTYGSLLDSQNGDIIFSIDTLTAREVVSTPVSPVPLPAGLPLLLSGIGGVYLLRRRKT